MRIESIDRDITLLPYTHRIAKGYNNVLLEGVDLSSLDLSDPKNPKASGFSINNEINATEYLIRELCGLTQDEIDNLPQSEFVELQVFVNDHISNKKK